MFYRRVDFAANKSTLEESWVFYFWRKNANILAPLIESGTFCSNYCLLLLIVSMVRNYLNLFFQSFWILSWSLG